MASKKQGRLFIIGGALQEGADNPILEAMADAADGGPMVLINAASTEPDGIKEKYSEMFKGVGIKRIELIDIRTRPDAYTETNIKLCKQASVLFFTGGDQLRITSQIGDSPVFRTLQERYQEGCTIAGSSAGAAAMPQTMIIGGPSEESNRVSALAMAPGLGLLPNVVVDSHFAERGRMGRLLGAVVQNSANLGVGIDEDTAILVDAGRHFRVIGSGAVYVIDGAGISYSSLSEDDPDGVVTIHDVKLHVLAAGSCFDLTERQPAAPKEARPEHPR